MAIIRCKHCGENVSEWAKICPHCGGQLIEEEQSVKFCGECGKELLNGAKECPYCGYPVQAENVSQNNAVTEAELLKKKSTKKIVVAVIAVIAIIAVCVASFLGFKAYKEKQQRLLLEESAQNYIRGYRENIKQASLLMIYGAADAENAGNLIKKVWYNSIYEEEDVETDPYTQPDGYFVDDFNTALGNLFSDSSFNETILSIKDNQDSVLEIMKSLVDPPEGLEEAYTAIKEYYSAYTKFTNLVISPKGSYNTFSSDFNEADSDLLSKYKTMELYID